MIFWEAFFIFRSQINQALLNNNSNTNLWSKLTAYITVARGCTRDMQQTNYLHRINWNWVRACRLSDAGAACSRDSILIPLLLLQVDRLAKISTCVVIEARASMYDLLAEKSVSCGTEIARSAWLPARVSLDPFRLAILKKKEKRTILLWLLMGPSTFTLLR